MLEILLVIALSVFAVVAAVAGIGMAGQRGSKNKKSHVESLKSSISNPLEKVSEVAETVVSKGMDYTGKVVKRANENSAIKSAAAAHRLLSGIYHIIAESNVRNMPAGFSEALEDAEDVYENPVRHLGKLGELADYLFLDSSLDKYSSGSSLGLSKSEALSLKERYAIQRTIEKYLENEGLGKYNVILKDDLIDKGRTAGVTEGKKMTLARFTRYSEGKRAQTIYDLLLTAKHERMHQRQEELGIFAGEEYVELATLLESKKKREDAYAKGDYLKAGIEDKLYMSNLEYILRQEKVDKSYFGKLMSVPEIKKEVQAYRRGKAERNRDVV